LPIYPRPFDVARDPDPLVDSALAEALLRAPELGVARGGQRRLERGTEVAAVVDGRVAVAVRHPEVPRKLVRTQVVPPADLRRVQADPPREAVDGPVHREHGLRPTRPAVRGAGGLVGDDRRDLHLQIADAVRPEEVGDRVVREYDAPAAVGAEVEPDVITDGEDHPVPARGESDLVHLVP